MDPNLGNSSSLPEPAPVPAAGQSLSPPASPLSPPAATPHAAEDSDRIEREWVLKTRQIQLATHNDPYEQAKQLAALRADYMAKRYNKVIQTGE